MPSSGVKQDESSAVARDWDEGRKRASTAMGATAGSPSSAGSKLVVTPGEPDQRLHRRVAAESRSASSYGGATSGNAGPLPVGAATGGKAGAGGQEQEKAAVSGKSLPDQDVLLVKLVVAPQALERHALERLLDEQQIVATVARGERSGSQYVGDAAPEKLAALLKELRLRKVDFPSIVEGSQAANSLLFWGAAGDRSADDSNQSRKIQLDQLKRQSQAAQPVIEMQQQTQLRGPQADAAKAVPESRRVRFVFQVIPAELSASSAPAATPSPAKPAVRSNPLRRAAGPSSNAEPPQ
jgi:hypothetical protein